MVGKNCAAPNNTCDLLVVVVPIWERRIEKASTRQAEFRTKRFLFP
jgi:hypothetical protein